jgi:hypothetical protein
MILHEEELPSPFDLGYLKKREPWELGLCMIFILNHFFLSVTSFRINRQFKFEINECYSEIYTFDNERRTTK